MRYIYMALALALLIGSAIGAEPRIGIGVVNWTQALPSGEGVKFSGTAPGTTTNTLYSDAGTLKFNGDPVGGSSASRNPGYVTVGPWANCTYQTDGTADDVQLKQAAWYCDNSTYIKDIIVLIGNYSITSLFTVPSNVHVKGSGYARPMAAGHVWTYNKGITRFDITSSISAVALKSGAWLDNIAFYYPTQQTNATPTSYPYTIILSTTGVSSGGDTKITDCFGINPYQFISLVGSGENDRIYVNNVVGHPLYRGITIDNNYDVDRIENVHFWDFYSETDSVMNAWVWANGIAFDVEHHADWALFQNCFAFGYHNGLLLYSVSCVHFVNGGFDASYVPINMNGATNCIISNNELVSTQWPSGGTGGSHAIYVASASTDNIISNNDIRCNGIGIAVVDSSHRNIIEGNQVNFGWRNDVGTRGIWILSGNRNIVSGNKVYGGAHSQTQGILVETQYNTVTGNQIDSCTNAGLYLSNDDYNVITGNSAYSSGALVGSAGAHDVKANNIGM